MFSDCKTLKEVKSMWRKLASRLHPDHGGDASQFNEARKAYGEALKKMNEPVKCPACGGSGKIPTTGGFHTIYVTCRKCGGTGKMKRGKL